MTAHDAGPQGKIVTFYSYKGGTGRSMALANVAWILASAGKRVLTIDWDLEAPGLHHYFEPFLDDASLAHSTGVVDFVRDFATAALARTPAKQDADWYEEYADILAHAVPLDWKFVGDGALHFVPAGRQDASYGVRVNGFDWESFYARLGGGILLEQVKANLRQVYDFVFIDSRTGVSDTSGICTMQMPDELVVCFTLNRQSIYGAAAAARTAFVSRHTPAGEPTLRIWPVPMRVEASEKDRMEIASTLARVRFSGLMPHLAPDKEDIYWGEIPVQYEPYYAYEEVLAAFRDRPRQRASLLARMETIAGYLNDDERVSATIDESLRAETLVAFLTRSASAYEQEFLWLGDEYENIRKRMSSGNNRTRLMEDLVSRAQLLAGKRDAGVVGDRLFARSTEGARVIGLALAERDPQRQHLGMALSGIGEMRSPFEQYHALLLAEALTSELPPSGAAQLRATIGSQIGKTIRESDSSRFKRAHGLVNKLSTLTGREPASVPPPDETDLAGERYPVVNIGAPTHVRYADADETHGRWVVTRGTHALRLSEIVRLGQLLVTNALFMRFVAAGGYDNDDFWTIGKAARRGLVTYDGSSPGPGNWASAARPPEGQEDHPVSSICYAEATAFVAWCNAVAPLRGDLAWSLPPEDHWEFAARSEEGLIYPWGDAFDASRCNSAESNFRTTTPVTRYESGASRAGCYDMAGNVWEFVFADDTDETNCVLRGGSFSNNRFEVRSYLRLFAVPVTHRPPDFGFRLAQVDRSTAERQGLPLAL
jgi:hypothetical protein